MKCNFKAQIKRIFVNINILVYMKNAIKCGLMAGNRPYIVAFLAVVWLMFWLQAKNDVLVGDEIVYTYVLDTDKYGSYWVPSPEDRHIETVSDVISSQCDHYLHWHGRNIVMAVEQFFSGVSSPAVFYFLNAFVFVAAIILTMLVACDGEAGNRLSAWLLVVLAFFYLFPMLPTLWNSICYGVNYLWPTVFILVLLQLWHKAGNGELTNKAWYPLLLVIGIICGWSHEAFCLPVSGMLVVYYCFNIRKFRGMQAVLVSAFWIGSLILLLAPGNYVRAGSGSWATRFMNAFNLFCELRIVWLLLVAILVCSIKRIARVKDFFKENRYLFLLLGFSMGFVLLANTGVHTCTFVELVSLILLVRLWTVFVHSRDTARSRILWAAIVLLFIVHQSMIIAAEWNESNRQKRLLAEYATSSDGVVHYAELEASPLVKPWVKTWAFYVGYGNSLNSVGFSRYYTNSTQPFILVNDDDFDALANTGKFYIRENRVAGNSGFYTTEEASGFWMPYDSLRADKFEYLYAPVQFSDDAPMTMKLKRLLSPGSYPLSAPVDSLRLIDCRYGKYWLIDKPVMRKVIGIRAME